MGELTLLPLPLARVPQRKGLGALLAPQHLRAQDQPQATDICLRPARTSCLGVPRHPGTPCPACPSVLRGSAQSPPAPCSQGPVRPCWSDVSPPAREHPDGPVGSGLVATEPPAPTVSAPPGGSWEMVPASAPCLRPGHRPHLSHSSSASSAVSVRCRASGVKLYQLCTGKASKAPSGHCVKM